MMLNFEINSKKYDYRIKEFGDGVFILDEDNKVYIQEENISAEIEAEVDRIKNIESFRLLREERNSKLSETDWWAGSDLTITAEQTVYRQTLRDLPSTASPELDGNGELTNVTWPTKPE